MCIYIYIYIYNLIAENPRRGWQRRVWRGRRGHGPSAPRCAPRAPPASDEISKSVI